MPPVRKRLPRAHRLRSKRAFRDLIRRGTRIDGQWFLLLAMPNERRHGRLGLSASRKVGDAVRRNRAKRLLREIYRECRPAAPVDLLLVAKSGIVGRSLNELKNEFRERLRRLHKRWAKGPTGNAPLDRN